MGVPENSAATTLTLTLQHEGMPSSDVSPASGKLSLLGSDRSEATSSPAASEAGLLAEARAAFYASYWTDAVDDLNFLFKHQGACGTLRFDY